MTVSHPAPELRISGLLHERRVAETIGVDRATLWRWRRLGLPHYRVGGRVYYDARDLDAWVERSRVTATQRSPLRRRVSRRGASRRARA